MNELELHALNDLLKAPVFAERAMDVCVLEGFLTALVIGPRMIMPSAWMPWVWDKSQGLAEPEFAGQDEAGAVIGPLMQLYNEVASGFVAQPPEFHPLYLRCEGPWGVENWCEGFLIGMRLAFKEWSPLLVGAPALFAPFLTLGDAADIEAMARLSDEQIEDLADAVVPNVMKIAAHWRASGAFAPSGPAPIRRDAPKLGRNDPCHCGSGLKYKKCHGLN